jgi:hypothetical protein
LNGILDILKYYVFVVCHLVTRIRKYFNDPERKRTTKKSAEVYSQIIKSNKIPVEFLNVENSQ